MIIPSPPDLSLLLQELVVRAHGLLLVGWNFFLGFVGVQVDGIPHPNPDLGILIQDGFPERQRFVLMGTRTEGNPKPLALRLHSLCKKTETKEEDKDCLGKERRETAEGMQKAWIHREELQLALYFVLFSIISGFVLNSGSFPMGGKLFSLVLFFHVSFPLLARLLRWHTPFQIWKCFLPLSLWMVFPDWFLSQVLGVLHFVPDSFPRIGTVSLCMLGLWTIPLFLLAYLGIKLEEMSVSLLGACLWIAFFSLLLFGASEELLSFVWYADNVKKLSNVAIYVLVPEMLLGLTSYLAFQGLNNEGFWMWVGIGFLIMLQYLGSLSFFYLLVEKIFT